MTDAVARLNAALEGRYAIEREVGEGGMATVYLADDLKHERKVALKVLKPELAAVVGAERFLAEIKTTANLTHPHILPLHDSGEADGFLFYVMPHIEGESLRDRIDREKQLPVDEAVKITTDLAEALDYAHRHKIIHRDIKPANILMHEGRPLIADFGIALAVGVAGGGRLTETGLSVGTPHYMSPEQATGHQTVGVATDIYALGAVLYEMLVGEPPYTGSTAQAILGKIIAGKLASATEERASVPANVDAAIRKALEKLPADRFTTVQEFAKALTDSGFRHGEEAAAGVMAGRGQWTPLSISLGVLAITASAVAAWSLLRPEAPQPVAQFESPFREGQEPLFFGAADFNVSPDGSMLVYTGPGEETPWQLWVRRWDNPDASPVRGTERGADPAVSPDGRQLAFNQGGEIKVLSFEGGPVRTLTTPGRYPIWGPDGYIYISLAGVVRVPATGGPREQLTQLLPGEVAHTISDFLPDGAGALIRVPGVGEIRSLNLDTGEMTTLTPGTWPRYSATGHLTFIADDGSLMAAPFDPRAMELTGPAVPIIERVNHYALSETGSLVYSTGGGAGGVNTELVWVTRSGDAVPVDPSWQFEPANQNYGWRLSPGGERVALTRLVDGNIDIWIKQLPDGPFQRLTFDDEAEWYPVWTPDGQSVTYVKGPSGGHRSVWRRRADGTGEPELLLDDERSLLQHQWSPDGEWMIFRTASTAPDFGPRDIVGFRPGVDSATVALLATADFAEEDPALSPDGRWLAYVSDETGQREIYVRPFPDVESSRVQVSTGGGGGPLWANSGNELFFVDSGGQLIAATVEAGSVFQVLQRETLFTVAGGYRAGRGTDFYDVAPDDQRFLMARSYQQEAVSNATGPRYVLVQNFFEELKRLVPN